MTEENPSQAEPGEPPDVPFLFGLALWVPTFAVLLWVMLGLFRRRAAPPADDVD